ncbi:MAG: orotidine-5'-phosphate decarboxylase [Alphaproteobacteria bacterium]|nr:orotidine-5'-phosphate decarboxylase [Alphaproteobacteria bacterium]
MKNVSDNPNSRIIVALDYSDPEKAMALVNACSGSGLKWKVGKELFTIAGPDIVKRIQDAGGYVFLDLKYHDIPNTVGGAAKAAAKLGVDLFNLHAEGGFEMMEAAVSGAKAGNPDNPPKVVGVTVLTSLNDRDMNVMGNMDSAGARVVRMGNLARLAGLDGLVCSPKELRDLRYMWPEAALITPGIVPEWAADNKDQKRKMTPAQAIIDGTTYMVIGRAITKAENPLEAIERIVREIEEAMPNHGKNALNIMEQQRVNYMLKMYQLDADRFIKAR